MSTPANTPVEDQTSKLMRLIKLAVDDSNSKWGENLSIMMSSLQVQVGQLELQLKTINKLLEEGGASKPKPRTKKTADAAPAAADAASPAPAGDASAPAAAPAPAAAADDQKFSPNAYHWFTKMYKSDAAFKAKYRTAAALELMKNDANINKKKTDAEKAAPEAKFLWTHYKTNDKATYDALNEEFAAAKALHENAKKPAAQQKEPDSP